LTVDRWRLTIDRWLLKGAALGVRINEGGIEHVTASRFEVRRASMIPNNIRLFERYIPSPPAYPVPANNQTPSVTGQKSTVNGVEYHKLVLSVCIKKSY
jgi:hypothetical protein